MKTHLALVVPMVAAGCAAWSQPVSFGVKGGIPVLDTVSNHDESRPYIVGPSVEFSLPGGFAIAADALYRRVGSSRIFGSFLSGANLLAPGGIAVQGPYISAFNARQRGNSWEFPILGKYYFGRRALGWQPFLGSGFAFRTVGFHSDATQTIVDAGGVPTTTSFKNDSRSPLDVGAVFSAGSRFHAGRFALSPEFRYTRWGGRETPLRRNEAGVLLGISF